MKRTISMLALIALLLIATFYFNNKNLDNIQAQTNNQAAVKAKEELPQINFKAPAFTLTSLDGQSYSLEKAKGKPLIINFWASWCGPCKIEAPELVQIYQQYQDKLEIYAINLTSGDQLKDVKKFVKEQGFTFPILLDESGVVSEKYQVLAIPTTYFVNENGVIVDKIMGYGGEGSLALKAYNLVNP